jgi:hypothetical protein
MQRLGIVLLMVVGLALAGGSVRAEVLITDAEARLPPAADAGMTMRGLTRGPGIEQEAPAPDRGVASPILFKIKFQVRNNVPIDPASIKLTYLKTPLVDITDRIKPHVKPDGIEMNRAEVPKGTHLLRLDLKDQQGRVATAMLKLTVN